MPFPRWLFVCLLPSLAPASFLLAQNRPPAASVLTNGGFEQSLRTVDNLWDGVDGDGDLAVPTYAARALIENGIGNLAVPPSVAVADLNGDGKLDLLVASPTGYYFYYQNRGTATEPKFTNAEVVPLYLSSPRADKVMVHTNLRPPDFDRFCPRISLADWRKRGVLDLLVGNFIGEILFVPNSGTARSPFFAQPATLEKAQIPTNDRDRLWANFLSPAAADWNGDGKLDLLVGEGTYSANAVHLFENVGGETPKFTNGKHSYVAYGDGREHLIPAVVDFNGDGYPDLLVADRKGEIGVYLNPGPAKPGVELKRASTLTFGGRSTLPGLVSPTVADLNGDGLFDIVMGLPNGRIAVAMNTGTKTQPAFGAWQEIKGEDRLKRTVRICQDWEMLTASERGNGYGYWQVVNAQEDPASAPPEGVNCMKAAYWPPLVGGLFPYPDTGIQQAQQYFVVTHPVKLQVNKNYKLSFQAKGAGMQNARWTFYDRASVEPGTVKMERGERGEALRDAGRVNESIKITGEFSVSSNWSSVEKTINAKYKNAAFANVTEIDGDFSIQVESHNLSSVLYLDDIQIVPQG